MSAHYGAKQALRAAAICLLGFALLSLAGCGDGSGVQSDIPQRTESVIVNPTTLQETMSDLAVINKAEAVADPVLSKSSAATVGNAPMSAVSFESYMSAKVKKHVSHIDTSRFFLKVNQFQKTYDRFRADNRQITCVYFRYTFWYNAAGYVVAIDLTYKCSKATCAKERKKFKRGVKKYLRIAKKYKSKAAKAKAIHDYMTKRCQYDVSAYRTRNYMSHAYDAYGVFGKKKAVCQGYAEAYQYLMEKLRIPCVVVSNKVIDHAWNYVKLNGKWRNVDVTWDDPIPDRGSNAYPLYTYYFKTDKQFLRIGHANYLTVDVTSKTKRVKRFKRWA